MAVCCSKSPNFPSKTRTNPRRRIEGYYCDKTTIFQYLLLYIVSALIKMLVTWWCFLFLGIGVSLSTISGHWNFMEFLARNQLISMMMKMMLTEQQKKKVRRSWKGCAASRSSYMGGLEKETFPLTSGSRSSGGEWRKSSCPPSDASH